MVPAWLLGFALIEGRIFGNSAPRLSRESVANSFQHCYLKHEQKLRAQITLVTSEWSQGRIIADRFNSWVANIPFLCKMFPKAMFRGSGGVFCFVCLICVNRIIETWALLKKKKNCWNQESAKIRRRPGCLKLSKSFLTTETEVLLTQESVSTRIPRDVMKVYSKHLCPLDTSIQGHS